MNKILFILGGFSTLIFGCTVSSSTKLLQDCWSDKNFQPSDRVAGKVYLFYSPDGYTMVRPISCDKGQFILKSDSSNSLESYLESRFQPDYLGGQYFIGDVRGVVVPSSKKFNYLKVDKFSKILPSKRPDQEL